LNAIKLANTKGTKYTNGLFTNNPDNSGKPNED